jgi:hypothetical protein
MLNLQHTLYGRFRFDDLGGGNWRATNLVEPHESLFLHEMQGASAAALDGCRVLTIRWHPGGGVDLVLTLAAESRVLHAVGAFLHEPRDTLYEGLRLPRYDAAARRFWNTIFVLAQNSWGRRLLGWVASRRRRPG